METIQRKCRGSTWCKERWFIVWMCLDVRPSHESQINEFNFDYNIAQYVPRLKLHTFNKFWCQSAPTCPNISGTTFCTQRGRPSRHGGWLERHSVTFPQITSHTMLIQQKLQHSTLHWRLGHSAGTLAAPDGSSGPLFSLDSPVHH